MEAMCVGVPVAANRTGAVPELLADGRGWIVDWLCWYYDPFGNQRRYFIDVQKAADALEEIANNKDEVVKRTAKARAYMETKNWDVPAKQVEYAIEKL
jgi:glycosyltransferase involved in cell wall biosynthesis